MVRALIAALSPTLMLVCDYREYTRSVTPPATPVQHSGQHSTTMRNRVVHYWGLLRAPHQQRNRGMAKRAAQRTPG